MSHEEADICTQDEIDREDEAERARLQREARQAFAAREAKHAERDAMGNEDASDRRRNFPQGFR